MPKELEEKIREMCMNWGDLDKVMNHDFRELAEFAYNLGKNEKMS